MIAPPRERMPSIVAGTLAALWLPLTALAVAMGWRSTFQIDHPSESMWSDFAAHGSAISGPLAPHVVMALAALLSRRPGRTRTIATAIIGVLGLLLIGNSVAGAFMADPKYTSRPIIVAGAIFYFAFGLAFTITAVRALRAPHGPHQHRQSSGEASTSTDSASRKQT